MPIPNPSGFGLGSRGATSTDDCLTGINGANGLDGAHGLGAHGEGRLVDDAGYLGMNGNEGGKGFPGQGGGGTRGGAIVCGDARKAGGASGGSGGSGGCGAGEEVKAARPAARASAS